MKNREFKVLELRKGDQVKITLNDPFDDDDAEIRHITQVLEIEDIVPCLFLRWKVDCIWFRRVTPKGSPNVLFQVELERIESIKLIDAGN